jgi:ribonuclease Y
MELTIIDILIVAGGVAAGAVISVLVLGKKILDPSQKIKSAEELVLKAEKEKAEITTSAKERVKRAKDQLEHEVKNHEERTEKIKKALLYKEDVLDKKQKKNEELKLKIASQKEESSVLQDGVKKLERKFTEKLCDKTGENTAKLKELITERYIKEAKEEAKEHIAHYEETTKENAQKTAKKILINAIQRMCSPTSVETSVILITVPKDEIKGRIVGKDGKNIQEFEKTLEVDIIFNDLPNTISISGYNLVNRRIAQKAMELLIKEKRIITPEIIRESIKRGEKEIDKELTEIGEKTIKALGIQNLDKELIKTIGRLQYRTSYGQNIMKHSMEVSWIATMLGSELGLDLKVCKVGGFLHDLGKAIDQDPNVQGTHDFLTKELMTKYGFSEAEIHAAWTHHDSEQQKTPEALIVKAADAVSAGRPGARQESIERYAERIAALEDAGKSFDGVKKAYAISAGRELRVLVDPERIDDGNMKHLAEEIAKKIQTEISYPGKIKVNTIRRTSYTEISR